MLFRMFQRHLESISWWACPVTVVSANILIKYLETLSAKWWQIPGWGLAISLCI
jgi:hypothetical protein